MAIRDSFEDAFEKLVEQGATQAKKAVKSAGQQVKQTVSPTKMWEQLLGTNSSQNSPNSLKSQKEKVGKGNNHTPLDIEKLNKKYQDNDKQKTEILRQRLFQLVKQGEEKVLYEKKKEEAEKKQKELYEAQMKKKKEEEKKKQEQTGQLPKGKVRKSIFSPKKTAERQHAELKPASGKQ